MSAAAENLLSAIVETGGNLHADDAAHRELIARAGEHNAAAAVVCALACAGKSTSAATVRELLVRCTAKRARASCDVVRAFALGAASGVQIAADDIISMDAAAAATAEMVAVTAAAAAAAAATAAAANGENGTGSAAAAAAAAAAATTMPQVWRQPQQSSSCKASAGRLQKYAENADFVEHVRRFREHRYVCVAPRPDAQPLSVELAHKEFTAWLASRDGAEAVRRKNTLTAFGRMLILTYMDRASGSLQRRRSLYRAAAGAEDDDDDDDDDDDANGDSVFAEDEKGALADEQQELHERYGDDVDLDKYDDEDSFLAADDESVERSPQPRKRLKKKHKTIQLSSSDDDDDVFNLPAAQAAASPQAPPPTPPLPEQSSGQSPSRDARTTGAAGTL